MDDREWLAEPQYPLRRTMVSIVAWNAAIFGLTVGVFYLVAWVA